MVRKLQFNENKTFIELLIRLDKSDQQCLNYALATSGADYHNFWDVQDSHICYRSINHKKKYIMSTREMGELSTKQEGGRSTNDTNKKIFSTPSSWSRSKDPRIVQVSRAFGGKDRHTKVCTVKGLRDRRVRLSVSTAITLYELQDRLGLNQPSKVFDWLLNAAKDDIDELPPLQIPPGLCFPQNLECSANNNISKEMVEEEEGRESPESLEGLMNNSNNNSMTFSSWTRWDASNLLSLSHASQPPEEQFHNFGTINYMPTGLLSQQYPSHGLAHQSYLSPINSGSVEDFEPNKHIGLQMWSTNSLHHQQSDQHQEQNIRPFHFSMMPNRESEPNKESEYDSSR